MVSWIVKIGIQHPLHPPPPFLEPYNLRKIIREKISGAMNLSTRKHLQLPKKDDIRWMSTYIRGKPEPCAHDHFYSGYVKETIFIGFQIFVTHRKLLSILTLSACLRQSIRLILPFWSGLERTHMAGFFPVMERTKSSRHSWAMSFRSFPSRRLAHFCFTSSFSAISSS